MCSLSVLQLVHNPDSTTGAAGVAEAFGLWRGLSATGSACWGGKGFLFLQQPKAKVLHLPLCFRRSMAGSDPGSWRPKGYRHTAKVGQAWRKGFACFWHRRLLRCWRSWVPCAGQWQDWGGSQGWLWLLVAQSRPAPGSCGGLGLAYKR